jgi:DNA-directed RNA polymerase I, II, and III subunit RPABC1
MLKHIWDQEKIFIIIINIQRLQFNILEHTLVPKHIVLSEDEARDFKKQYNILDDSHIPAISRFSPVSQVIGIRPGQICRIQRPSKTSITTNFYRICSQ